MSKKKLKLSQVIQGLADAEAELDIILQNPDKFTSKDIKSVKSKLNKMTKALNSFPDNYIEEPEDDDLDESLQLQESKRNKINRKIAINEDNDIKNFNVIKVVDNKTLKELYNDNAFILLGVDVSDDNLENLVDILKRNNHLKDDIAILYVIKGSFLNNLFSLGNEYKSNMNIVAIRQQDLLNIDKLRTSTMYQLSVCTNWLGNLILGYGIPSENIDDYLNNNEEGLELAIEDPGTIEESWEMAIKAIDEIDLGSSKPQYIRTNEGPMEVKIDPFAPAPLEYDEGMSIENGGSQEELDEAQKNYKDINVISFTNIITDDLYAYAYTEKQYEDLLNQLDAQKVDIKDLIAGGK